MAAHVRVVQVSEVDRRELQRRVRDKAAPARVVERARIVLLAADEVPGKQIATTVGCAEGTVVTWRGPRTPTPSSPRPPIRDAATHQARPLWSTRYASVGGRHHRIRIVRHSRNRRGRRGHHPAFPHARGGVAASRGGGKYLSIAISRRGT
ncbi:helix-turn-helix domain-containing protein [Geodermatophilus sp. SYSU D00758]